MGLFCFIWVLSGYCNDTDIISPVTESLIEKDDGEFIQTFAHYSALHGESIIPNDPDKFGIPRLNFRCELN
jgi:hypothetical protein